MWKPSIKTKRALVWLKYGDKGGVHNMEASQRGREEGRAMD